MFLICNRDFVDAVNFVYCIIQYVQYNTCRLSSVSAKFIVVVGVVVADRGIAAAAVVALIANRS